MNKVTSMGRRVLQSELFIYSKKNQQAEWETLHRAGTGAAAPVPAAIHCWGEAGVFIRLSQQCVCPTTTATHDYHPLFWQVHLRRETPGMLIYCFLRCRGTSFSKDQQIAVYYGVSRLFRNGKFSFACVPTGTRAASRPTRCKTRLARETAGTRATFKREKQKKQRKKKDKSKFLAEENRQY